MLKDIEMLRIAILSTIFLLYTATSHAKLIERDLVSTGDGLITYDTQTGLEWLDTRIHSYAKPYDVYWGWLNGRDDRIDPIYAEVNDGWSMAPLDQIRSMFSSYTDTSADFIRSTPIGETYGSAFVDESERNGMGQIASLILGHTSPRLDYQIYFGGALVSGSRPSNNVGYVNIGVYESGGNRYYSSYGIYDDVTSPKGLTLHSGGAFLVRTAEVPTPSTLWLWGLGFSTLIARRAKRKKRP